MNDRINQQSRFTANCAALLLFITASVSASADLTDTCWTPSFDEPFDKLALWDAATGEGRWKTAYIWPRDVVINNELQFYVDPREHPVNPFTVDDGKLIIRADHAPREMFEFSDQPFTSGVLTTEKSFSQKHGRFETRVKVPPGQGLWPAFWLLPSFDRWPEGIAVLPELDVMEFLGHQPSTFHTTVHTNQSGGLTSHPYDHNAGTDLTAGFHLYSVVWDNKNVTWYFDRKQVAQHPTPTDFTQPKHFLLNLAVGGNWPGSPDAKTTFPADYVIDYVRAWTATEGCH